MKLKRSIKQSPFNEGGGIPEGMTGDLNGLNSHATPNNNTRFSLCVLFCALLYALCAMPAFAQQENTISNDGTTSSFWSVGYDSSARLGIGLSWGEAISNTLTLRDSGSAGSQTFISGWLAGSGWKIEADSSLKYRLTIDELTVRGTLSVYELMLNQVKSTNGNLLVTTSAVVDSVARDRQSFWVADVTDLNTAPFAAGDIIICQGANLGGVNFDGNGNIINNNSLIKRLIFQVTGTTGRRVFVTLAEGAPAQKNDIKKGDVFCRIGNTGNADRMGVLGLFSDEAHSPYLRVTDSVRSWADWQNSSNTKVQLGKLTGITDEDFGGQLEGYGLYANNAYIKGKIIVTNPSDFSFEMLWDSINNRPAYFNPPSGAGLFIGADNMGFYNTTTYPNDPWRTYMDSDGRFYLKGLGQHQLSWNGNTLSITGNIYLTNTIPVESIGGLGDLAVKDELGLDEIPDGYQYARVLKTDIQSGHIKLSEAIGTIDDIDNGIYAKVLSTEISAGHIKITGSDGSTTIIEGGRVKAGSIKGSEIAAGTIFTSNLSFTPVQNTNVVASINASAEGIRITGNKILIDGTVSFASGYNIADKLDKGDAARDINDNITTIDGDKITTGTVTADKMDVISLSAITANLGTITSGTIDAVTVNVTNLNADNIKYGVLNADRIGSESITSEKIKTGTITASDISSNSITAEKLNITNLSAITANLGTVTAGNITGINIAGATITGGSLQTATSGQRVVISSDVNDIKFYGSSGTPIQVSAGGDGILQISNGVNIYSGANLTVESGYVKAAGYKTNDGYTGVTTTTGGLIFKYGLYTGGAALLSWSAITSKPSTISGYGITDLSASSSSSSASLYVASTTGGSATTQLKTRSLTIGNQTFTVLVAP